MSISNRIKELRTELGITQAEFADRLGTARNTIANYEIGRREPMEQTIRAICREFRVSYIWLTQGFGDMFEEPDMKTTALFDRIMAGENETAKSVFKAFANLGDEEWKVVAKIIDEIKK